MFCPQNAFVCFVCFSEQTATIALVFITETECVYCAVRIECLNIIQIKCSIQQRPLWFGPRSARVRLLVNKVAMGQFCLPVLRFFPVSTFPLIIHTHLHLTLSTRTNGRYLGTFQHSSALSEIGDHRK